MYEAAVVAGGVTDAAALLARIPAAPLWQLSEDDLEATVAAVFAAESALAAARAVVLAAADERSLRSRAQAPTTQRWLTQRLLLSRARADAVVREADLVVAEPALLDALASARCTPEQATVIGTIVAGLPPVTPQVHDDAVALLLEQCAALDPAALARAGRHLHETLVATPDVDDPAEQAQVEAQTQQADADQAHRLRTLSWRRHVDGSISGRFRLDPLGGQTLLSAISALTARRDHEPRSSGADPADPAEATGLLPPPTADTRTIGQRRADALTCLASRALRGGQLPTRGGVPPTLVVTTTLDALEGRVAAAGLLPYGGTLDPASLRRLACDAQVIPAVLGADSQVLDLGRSRRLFTPAQRRAIALRDRGCIHPGCGAPPIDCEAHHAQPWYTGGPSDHTNGYLLCDHHHDRHHREGWTIHRDHRGNPTVIPPASVDPERRPRQHIRYQTQRLRT